MSEGADPEDPDEYRAVGISWVPTEARWAHIEKQAPQPTIGGTVDAAMVAIERDNPTLQGVLPKEHARPGLDKEARGQLIKLVSDVEVGGGDARSQDVLGRVSEYFLSQFASAEGRKGGQFYTHRGVVRVLVEMLAPYLGRVHDPCCGSGEMFNRRRVWTDTASPGPRPVMRMRDRASGGGSALGGSSTDMHGVA